MKRALKTVLSILAALVVVLSTIAGVSIYGWPFLIFAVVCVIIGFLDLFFYDQEPILMYAILLVVIAILASPFYAVVFLRDRLVDNRTYAVVDRETNQIQRLGETPIVFANILTVKVVVGEFRENLRFSHSGAEAAGKNSNNLTYVEIDFQLNREAVEGLLTIEQYNKELAEWQDYLKGLHNNQFWCFASSKEGEEAKCLPAPPNTLYRLSRGQVNKTVRSNF